MTIRKILRAEQAPPAPANSPPSPVAPKTFDLEGAYDELFRRVNETAGKGETFPPLSAPSFSSEDWVYSETVPGGWAEQAQDFNPDPALAGLSGKDVAEMVLALLRDRGIGDKSRQNKPAEGADPKTSTPDTPPSSEAPPETAPAAERAAVPAPAESEPTADGTSSTLAEIPETATTRFADLDSSAGDLSGWGALDRLAPEEYAEFRESPSRQNFDRLVSAIALPQYEQLKTDLERAYAELSNPGELAAFAAKTGLEAYDLEQLVKAAGNVDYAFAELPYGSYSFVNELYLKQLREKYPGLGEAEYAKYDLSNMTKEQFLAVPDEQREKMIAVLESNDPESAQFRLGRAMRTLASARVGASNFESAKNIAIERYAELTRENPELIALLRESSPFAYDLCANMPAHIFRFDGSTFRFNADLEANRDHVYGRVAAMGTGPFLEQLDRSAGEIQTAIDQIQENPGFEKLAYIATEVARRIGADVQFFEHAPEGADYQNALATAEKYMGDAAREKKLHDIGMTALGGATAALGVGALVGGFFSFGATWALAGAAGATGLGFSGLQVADLCDRNWTSRFNIEGYADVNGVQKPTAGEWALAILDGAASAADLGLVARPFISAIRAKMIVETGLSAADAAKAAQRLEYFDDLDTVSKLLRPISHYPTGVRSQLAGAMTDLTDPQLIELSRLLDDPVSARNLATTISDLDPQSSSRLLNAMTGAFQTTDTKAQLELIARLKNTNPATNTLLASPEGYQNIAQLRRVGSEKLVDAWVRQPDLQGTLDQVLGLRLDASLRDIDGDALLRGVGNYEPDLVFGLAAHGGGTAALDEIARGMKVASRRGLNVDFTPQLAAYDPVLDQEVICFGPMMVRRGEYGVEMAASDSTAGRSMLEYVANRQSDRYDFSAAYPYLVPEDAYVAVANGSSSAHGPFTQYENTNRAVVEGLNSWIKQPAPTFDFYDSQGTSRRITILGPFTDEESAALQETMRAAAETNAGLLNGMDEIQFVENIGYYDFHNAPGVDGKYGAGYLPATPPNGKSRIMVGHQLARSPEIMWHEMGHRFWETEQLGGLSTIQNPYLANPDVGRMSWYGGVSPQENFCEAVSLVMRDRDLIRQDATGYVNSFKGYENMTPEALAVAREKLAWTIGTILGITVIVAPNIPPAPPDGRDSPTPY
jgi:hypothetical protein